MSHKGVVRLLELALPHAIDKLQADEGHRDGQKPVVVDDVPLEVWAVDGWVLVVAAPQKIRVDECIQVKLQKRELRDFWNLILGSDYFTVTFFFLVSSVDWSSWDDGQDLAQHVFNLDGCTWVGTVSPNVAGKTPARHGGFSRGNLLNMGDFHCLV